MRAHIKCNEKGYDFSLSLNPTFFLTDDIRQDAVMQQVFSTMNVFLRNQRHQSPGILYQSWSEIV